MAREEAPTSRDWDDELTLVTWRSHPAVISYEHTWGAEDLTEIASSSSEAATERQMESWLSNHYANNITQFLPLCMGSTRAGQVCLICWNCRTDFIWGWISCLRCSSSCTIIIFYLCAIKRSCLWLNYVVVDSDGDFQSPFKLLELNILHWTHYSCVHTGLINPPMSVLFKPQAVVTCLFPSFCKFSCTVWDIFHSQ